MLRSKRIEISISDEFISLGKCFCLDFSIINHSRGVGMNFKQFKILSFFKTNNPVIIINLPRDISAEGRRKEETKSSNLKILGKNNKTVKIRRRKK